MADVILPHTFRDGRGNVASGQQVMDNFNALLGPFNVLQAAAAAGWDADDLEAGLRAVLGVSDATTRRRGKSVVAAEESYTGTAFASLATPDRVAGVTLPTDGLLFVAFSASWKIGAADNGYARAAIFLGNNQLRVGGDSGVAAVQEARAVGGAYYRSLATTAGGLVAVGWDGIAAHGSDVTTGQIVGLSGVTDFAYPYGGVVAIKAAAGTYDVSVRYCGTPAASPSVTVTAKNRSLWVWTQAF